MPVLAFPGQPDTPAPEPGDGPAAGPSVAEAVERFLGSLPTATTRVSYARTLPRLAALAGPRPVAGLEPDDYAAVMEHVHSAAAATWNRHLSALVSVTTWAQRQDLLASNPARRLERRKPARRGDRCPVTERGRLSYPRAEYLFKTASAELDPQSCSRAGGSATRSADTSI